MPKTSSSPSPNIIPMSPVVKPPSHQTLPPNTPLPPPPVSAAAIIHDDVDILHSIDHNRHHNHQSLLMDDDDDPSPHPPGTLAHAHSPFSFLLRVDDEDDEPDEEEEIYTEEALAEEAKPSSVDAARPTDSSLLGAPAAAVPPELPRIDPAPHVSSQFYTFNRESHALMVRCIVEGRLATPEEIREATPRSVLKSWRSVWKDRNEDTAYLTAWKRIQDKLQAHMDGALPALLFKNNPVQRVSHVDQWQEIVSVAHADPDLLRHLGLKETVDRIKQSWTVGAKFYGIPESFIRVCVSSCPVCTSASSSLTPHQGSTFARSKRRRFEYTESCEVPAKDVQRHLQQLAAKHKVVLCIRQKYIRYKPFMAEVKDYACHRAGEPSSTTASAKKARVLKREPYQSKRCGCGFRIRAIVPITDYNEKDKTFVYQEEGTAVFKMYAVHTGHQPGPLDGNARIIHRVVGNKGAFDFDSEIYGVREDIEPESFVNLLGKDDTNDTHHIVLQQVQELRVEASMLEGKIDKLSPDMLRSLSHGLSDILYRLRRLGLGLQHAEEVLLVGDDVVTQWANGSNHHLDGQNRIFSKDADRLENDETDFAPDLGAIVPWDRMATDCQDRKMLMRDNLKPDKWILKEHCVDFDDKTILNCDDDEDSKLIKPLSDPSLVGMQVEGFYADSSKWYDSPSGLDHSTDSGDGGFRNGGIL